MRCTAGQHHLASPMQAEGVKMPMFQFTEKKWSGFEIKRQIDECLCQHNVSGSASVLYCVWVHVMCVAHNAVCMFAAIFP